MAKYEKETSRIPIKFIDSDTEETLFEIKDRNQTNVGDIFSNYIASSLMTDELKNKKMPRKIMVLAVVEYTLVEG